MQMSRNAFDGDIFGEISGNVVAGFFYMAVFIVAVFVGALKSCGIKQYKQNEFLYILLLA